VTAYSPEYLYERFGGIFCLHSQGRSLFSEDGGSSFLGKVDKVVCRELLPSVLRGCAEKPDYMKQKYTNVSDEQDASIFKIENGL
jgi:hypothetical protein